jgi:hypothetical protein
VQIASTRSKRFTTDKASPAIIYPQIEKITEKKFEIREGGEPQ